MKRWMDIAIAALLRGGVLLSVAVIVTGMVVTFVHHPETFHSQRPVPHAIHDVVHGVREGSGQAIVMAGLLLLIATPVARVAFSIVIFAIERDWLYTVITSGVLLLLLVSFVTGSAG
jgi:uncharacterized membrane protein